MAQTKKYDFRISQKDSEWVAEIIRRVSSKKIITSKSQGGFTSEEEANEWGKAELTSFLKKQSERNKRASEIKRQAKAGRDA